MFTQTIYLHREREGWKETARGIGEERDNRGEREGRRDRTREIEREID